MKLRFRKAPFTLVEMVVSLGVFSILMLIMFQMFTSAQKSWLISKSRADAYENAKIALDLISRDLQCVYYTQTGTPFWHGAYTGWDEFSNNEILAFVSATPVPPGITNSTLCEVKYQLAYVADHSAANKDKDGWLRRSVTGDSSGVKWNFSNNFIVGKDTSTNGATPPAPTAAFTAFEDDTPASVATSSSVSQKVIPHVLQLSFTCHKKPVLPAFPAGEEILPDANAGAPTAQKMPPYSIKISLTLMDKGAWDKWCALSNAPYPLPADINDRKDVASESDAAWEFRKNNQKTFTKTVFIGERGQQY